MPDRAGNEGYAKVCEDCTITEEAPTRAFPWLKAPTSARPGEGPSSTIHNSTSTKQRPGRVREEVEHPGPGAEDGDQPEHQVAAGDDQQQQQPEPQQDVDLVVHHVDREDAKTVESR